VEGDQLRKVGSLVLLSFLFFFFFNPSFLETKWNENQQSPLKKIEKTCKTKTNAYHSKIKLYVFWMSFVSLKKKQNKTK
jgi:hypothetical protein